jgi:L-arabinokinase
VADATVGCAPGRLDVLGGVADYSGALVLETPTRAVTTVTAEPAGALEVGPARLADDDVAKLAGLTYPEVRDALADLPRWTHYLVGVALVLVRHGVIDPPGARLTVTSDVPTAVGVSSSAALEVATARALGAGDLDPLRLAALCQEAENHVVGAPCGIMDQVTAVLGTSGRILPILCRPASVEPELALPPGVEAVGWPTGAEHDVGGGPYRRARAAAFMGKRMVEATSGRSWGWVSELPPPLVGELPEAVGGADFLDRFGGTEDAVTAVEPREVYPVRAATTFGLEEHTRTRAAEAHLASGDLDALHPLLAASHAGYDAMGLGHPGATAVVEQALARPGVHGARTSGGGSGGTVVVLCDAGALDDVAGLVR